MDPVWFVAALWLLLAVVAVLIANWLKVSTALSEAIANAQFRPDICCRIRREN